MWCLQSMLSGSRCHNINVYSELWYGCCHAVRCALDSSLIKCRKNTSCGCGCSLSICNLLGSTNTVVAVSGWMNCQGAAQRFDKVDWLFQFDKGWLFGTDCVTRTCTWDGLCVFLFYRQTTSGIWMRRHTCRLYQKRNLPPWAVWTVLWMMSNSTISW